MYQLWVVFGNRLSAPNKRSIKRACREHGLNHERGLAAHAAARAISKLPAVRRVELRRITVSRCVWVKGKRT